MQKDLRKNRARILLSILIGTGSGFVVFLVLIGFFFTIGLFGWSDGGEADYLRRLEISTNITFIISVIAALAVAVFVVMLMNKTTKQGKRSFPSGMH